MDIVAFRRNVTIDLPRLWQAFDSVEKSSQSIERSVREEIAKLRDEAATAARQSREELGGTLKGLEDTLNQDLDRMRETVDQKLQRLQQDNARQLAEVRADALASAKNLGEEITKTVNSFHESLVKMIGETVKSQQDQLAVFSAWLDKLRSTAEQKLDGVKTAVETELRGLQEDNAKQLEQLRATVEQQLQGAERRLGESFQSGR